MWLRRKRNSRFAERNQSRSLITIDVNVHIMTKTCVHDLRPGRIITTIEGAIARSYPLSMKYAKKRWLAFREIILEDDSGWIVVKIWGPQAIELLRGQQIQLRNVYCFWRNEALCLTLSMHSHLKICTQA